MRDGRSRHRETTIGCSDWIMTVFADIPPGLMRKFVVRTTLWIIFLGIVLFGTAGTMHWPQGWIYLGFLSVVSFVSGPWLAKHDPELFRERLGSYAYVRHPMYSGTLLFSVGTALLFGLWWGLSCRPVRRADRREGSPRGRDPQGRA